MAKVLLINRELGSYPNTVLVQGWSGLTYATSRWSSEHAGHIAEMSLEDYERCINDLAAAWHLPLRKWIPRFVIDEESNLRAKNDEWRALTETLKGQLLQARLATAFEQTPAKPLEKLPFFTLKKIAKDENVDIAGLKGCKAIGDAITAARTAKAATVQA